MNDFDDDLRGRLALRYAYTPPVPDVRGVMAAARRRRRKNRLAGALATVGVLCAMTLGYGAVGQMDDDGLSSVYASTPKDGEARVVVTPDAVRQIIDREMPQAGGTTGNAELLAENAANGVNLRIIGVRTGGEECVAVYQNDATKGAIGLTCGAEREVTQLELSRGSGDTDGLDRLSGFLPLGPTYVTVTGGGVTERIAVTSAGGGWRMAAFVTPWPGGRPAEVVAFDASGGELFRASI
jgi:hypothetical protein